jgi:long-chain fatty acid transport protein
MEYLVRPTFIFVMGLLVAVSRSVLAGGFENAGLGARATSMGGAFIGVADDWTAIYWNPAGLARLSGKGIGVTLERVRILTHDSNGLSNATLPLSQSNLSRGDVFAQFGGEPSQFNGQDSDFSAFLPGIGFFWKTSYGTLGFGSYSPLGFAFEVNDSHQAGFDASYKSQGYILNHNLMTFAKTVYPGVHIGAGINLVQAHLGRFSDKKAPGYESSASARSNGLGLQGVFGTLIELGKRVHLGGVYRTGQNLSLKGHADIEDSRFPVEASEFTQKIRNPTTYGVGLSYRPIDSLTFSTDWQRTEWRASRQDITFDQPGLILQNQEFDPGWSSTSRYRFGMEWRAARAWSVRAGYFRDPRAVSFDSQALTSLIDPDIGYFTSGISFSHASWRASLTNIIGSDQEVVGDQVLKKEVNSFILEFDYFI